jgi:TonB family protein
MLCRAFIVALLACLPPTNVIADDFAQRLRADFQKKIFLLRGFYQDQILRYDLSGALKYSGQVGSWTTSFVYVKSIDFKNDAVEIKGQRVVQVLDPKERRFKALRTDLNVLMRIENDLAAPASEDRVTKALAVVFIDPHESLAPLVPDYWRWVVNHYKYDGAIEIVPEPAITNSAVPITVPSLERLYKEGGNVQPPRGIKTPPPNYEEIARTLAIEGTAVIWLVVDEKGQPQRVRVGRPIGSGLDERALDVVNHWTFQPATKDGKPVAVQIAVEVNFRLH